MHSFVTEAPGYCWISVNFNSDWSGEAVITWRCRPDDALTEVRLPAADLIRGIHIPEEIPLAVAARTIATAVTSWWSRQIANAADNLLDRAWSQGR